MDWRKTFAKHLKHAMPTTLTRAMTAALFEVKDLEERIAALEDRLFDRTACPDCKGFGSCWYPGLGNQTCPTCHGTKVRQ